MSALTAAYAVYALVDPDHLGRALDTSADERAGYRLLTQSFGPRDLAVSALGLLGRDPATVRTAMLTRIAFDLGDCALLATRTTGTARAKAVGATVGWAGLNVAALLRDARRGG
jgi:hypothetical protein